MNIDLDGEFLVTATRSEAYRFLNDPVRFAPLLPHFKSLDEVTDDRFLMTIELGVPQIRGTAKVEVRAVERITDQVARFKSVARQAMGVVDSDLSFELNERGTDTVVHWRATSKVRGGLASIAGGILMPLAKRNVADMIDSVQRALGPVAAPSLEGAAEAPEKARSFVSRLASWILAVFGRRS
jgi:carbon monoxide dehydrogenase subunit G